MKIKDLFFLVLGRLADAYQVLGIQGLLTMLGSFSLWAWAAHASDWLNAWGPIAWVSSGFVGILVVSGALLAWAALKSKLAQSEYFHAVTQRPSHVNRLQSEFTRETIPLTEIMHPFGVPVSNKTFVGCDFIGPGIVVASGCQFIGGPPRFGNVEFAEINPEGAVIQAPNKLVLQNCALSSCRFFNLVLAVTPDSARDMRRLAPQTPWLTRQPEAAPPLG